MPGELFLKIDEIKGESAVAGHKDEIDLTSWEFKVTNPCSFQKGGGGSSGVSTVGDFRVTKDFDSASSKLFEACATGLHLPKVIFTQRKSTGGKTAEDFLTITLEKCVLSEYYPGGGEGGEAPSEDIAINFAKITIEYKVQQPNGTLAVKSPVTYSTLAKDAKAGK